MFEYEDYYLSIGKPVIAGIDEAGRGPLAGPVACACVIMPLDKNKIIDGVNDSKKLTAKQREKLYDKIINTAIAYSVELVDQQTIDRINILQATKQGMKECIEKLTVKPDVVLIDAVKLESNIECVPIIKGDSLSYSIACASIVAKVTRDKLMTELDSQFPNYNFKKHKGYGTKEHIAKIKEYGICELHRKSFVKNFINN